MPSSDSLAAGILEVQDFGEFFLQWSPKGLTELFLPGRISAAQRASATEAVPQIYRKPLERYFAGEDIDPVCLPVDLRGTEFQVRVWEALRRIPRGSVRSYAGVAIDVNAPRASRAVGMANSKNPISIVVPCHRVVEMNQKLGGYGGGLELKRRLLQLEGVRVEGGTVHPGQLDLFPMA